MTHSFILIRSRHKTHLLCHVTDASQWSQGWEPVDKMVCASTQHQHSDLVGNVDQVGKREGNNQKKIFRIIFPPLIDCEVFF